ncbi:hypothetical protein D9619_007539 [Psilocybe cf. subviscida]|uniref:Uncharacterized protein n=1 Tax=Psilocybe cf. subviscida TaxID=2480587 RepID=A0A8H5EWS0_9AGAR|nr:hypothetical protein D9619_007539 [Psilocybe cf. subviscida]
MKWRLSQKKGKLVYTLCLAILWLLVIVTLTLDWTRFKMTLVYMAKIGDVTHSLEEISETLWSLGSDDVAFTVKLRQTAMGHDAIIFNRARACTGADDIVSSLVVIIADALLVSAREIHACLGTSLIIFRIVSTTRDNPAMASRALYIRIQRIVFESGIIYSVGMLGIAPTLIALRVVQETPQTAADETQPLSNLMFNRSGLRNRTFGLSSLFSSIRLGFYSMESQLTGIKEDSKVTQCSSDEGDDLDTAEKGKGHAVE